MLISNVSGPLASGSSKPLYGGGIGYSYGNGLGNASGITQLQQALAEWSAVKQDNAGNPGAATGIIDPYTAIATIYVLWKVGDKIDALKTLKSVLGQIPLLGTLLGYATSNPTAMALAWRSLAIIDNGSPQQRVISFIDTNAAALAMGVRLATDLGPPPAALPPVSPAMTQLIFGGGSINKFRAPVPPGSIQTFDKKLGRFRVAVPIGLGMLGAITHQERSDLAALVPVPGAAEVSNAEFADKAGVSDLKPWYKTTLGMIGIGVGVVAIGAGGYYLLK